MQNKPEGWPDGGPVETIPEVFLKIDGSAWPPAQDGIPEGTAAVGEWSVDRELVGSHLPGQVRGPSGFSVATGSVSFPQAQGSQLSPWGRGGLRVGPGGQSVLFASHDGPSALSGVSLGQFRIAPISGSNTSNTVNLDLEDRTIQLNRPFTLRWEYNPVLPTPDAAWVIAKVAELNGHRVTPANPGGTKFAAQLVGSAEVTIGTLTGTSNVSWASSHGRIGMTSGSRIEGRFDASLEQWVNQLAIAACVSGRGGMVVIGTIVVDIRHDQVMIRDSTGGLRDIPLSPTADPIREMLITLVRVTANSLGVKIAERGGIWSEMIVIPTVDHIPFTLTSTPVRVTTSGYGGGGPADRWINGVRIWEHTGAASAPPASEVTALIEHTMSPLSGVFGVENLTSWNVIQDIAKATLGAAWVDELGNLVYRNREGLRAREWVETVEALDSIESLEWTIDPGDVADRVEVNYTPAEVFEGGDIITLWESTDKFNVGPGRTTSIKFDITGATDRVSAFMPIWDDSQAETRFSRWAAATSPDGSGERPADTALRFSAEIIGPSRVQLNITNRSSERLWLVDGSGNPCLIVRTSRHVAPGEPETLAAGVPEVSAASPLTIDAGAWVQDVEAAQELLSFARSQTARAQATLNRVRVKPDLARQLGDIVRLTDGLTELSSKAIITGVHLSGNNGGYRQELDMCLLDNTFLDLDQIAADLQFSTFSQLDAHLSSLGITTFNQFDDWLEDIGGTS